MMTYTLTGAAVTITLPPYNVFTGTSNVPAQGNSGTMLTIETSQNNFDGAPTTTSSSMDTGYNNRTKIFYSYLELANGPAAGTVFGNGTDTQKVPITLTSPCIQNNTLYYVDLFALGSLQYAESDMSAATGNTVTGNIEVTVNGFPNGVKADIVLSH